MGIQKEETAERIDPRGSRWSLKFLLDDILTSSPFFVEIFVHVLKLEAPIALQKEETIRCASFKVLFLPADVGTPRRTNLECLSRRKKWKARSGTHQRSPWSARWWPWRRPRARSSAASWPSSATRRRPHRSSPPDGRYCWLRVVGSQRARPTSPEN